MNRLALTILMGFVLLAGPAAGAQSIEALNKQAVAAYQEAFERYGLAMGERQDPADPAVKLLLGQIAELLCLRADAVGCLDASAEAGREPGPYAPVLGQARVPAPARFAAGRAFLHELHGLSAGWGKDAAVASEASGLLAQLEGDHLRARLGVLARPAYRKALARARKGPKAKRLAAWLRAAQLAEAMLDQHALVTAGLGLADAVLDPASGLDPEQSVEVLAAVLTRTRDTLRILGQADRARTARLDAALDRLATKQLAAPDLQFELGPAAERFDTDLKAAGQQLADLAKAAPLRSRASVLLGFFGAYARVLDGDPDAAEGLAVLAETLELTDPYLAARSQGLLGRTALLTGDYHRAARALESAAAGLAGQPGCGALVGLMQANRAQALFYLGRHPAAADAFAAAASALTGRPADRARALIGRAHSLAFAHRLEPTRAALAEAEAALSQVPADQRAPVERSLALTRGLAQIEAGQIDAAVATFRAIADEALEAGDVRAGAVARTNLAELLNDRGQADQALAEAQAALKWLDEKSQADAAWQARCEKGRALAKLGRPAQAMGEFELAMDLVEHLRARIGAEGARRTFAAAKQRLYREAVGLLIADAKPARAFAVAERARGRAFLDMLGERRIRLGRDRDQAALAAARGRMLRALPPLRLGFDGPGRSLRPTARKPQPARVPAADPRVGWLSLVTVNPARVSDVQAVLGEAEGLVAFFHDGQKLHAFLVTRKGLHHGATEVSAESLGNRVADLLRKLRQPAKSDRKVRRKAGKLFKLTFGPLAPELAGLKRLVVVPWGPLHYVPMGALHDGRRYLVDAHEVSSVPSASTLVMIRSGQPHRRKLRDAPVLVMGNPVTDLEALPAAEREADLLGKLFSRAEVLKRDRATKQTFVDDADGARLIHLASHGVFLPDRPMESYLALAGPDPEHGRLRALEILGLDLSKARLVMLSACSSGEVEVEAGDEIVGLSRAFLHAGSPALVASLWPLADEGALSLVGGFYKRLKGGEDPTRALTEAIRELKSKKDFSHPFFWAPFELIGS